LAIDVAPASFAEGIGFFRGDLIAEINEKPVTSVSEYNAAQASLKPGQQVVFKVLRHDESGRVLTVYLAGVVPTAQEQ
jgi:S1-C subfamily serine protease